MNLSYEKSYSIASNVLDRIENLDEFPEITKVAVIGSYHTYSSNIGGIVPYIIGVDQDNFLNLDFHYLVFVYKDRNYLWKIYQKSKITIENPVRNISYLNKINKSEK